MVFIPLALMSLSIILIYKSSLWVIRYAVGLSRIAGISTFSVGFILVAFSTSLPEFFVTIYGGIEGNQSLALGNLLGSNLFDLTIIGILAVLFGAVRLKDREIPPLADALFLSSLLLLIIFSLSRLYVLHGLMLLGLYSYIMAALYKKGKGGQVFDHGGLSSLGYKKQSDAPLTLLKFVLSIAVLLIGARLLVDSSLQIAGILGLTAGFIGATLVAIGTSVPELSISINALRKKHHGLAVGNLIGSAVTTITFLLGVLALISRSPPQIPSFYGMFPFLLIATLLVWYIFSRQGKITRYEGVILVLLYLGFVLSSLGMITVFI